MERQSRLTFKPHPLLTNQHHLGRRSYKNTMTHISAADLDRVLVKSRQQDQLGRKIASAIELIESVIDDLG